MLEKLLVKLLVEGRYGCGWDVEHLSWMPALRTLTQVILTTADTPRHLSCEELRRGLEGGLEKIV